MKALRELSETCRISNKFLIDTATNGVTDFPVKVLNEKTPERKKRQPLN